MVRLLPVGILNHVIRLATSQPHEFLSEQRNLFRSWSGQASDQRLTFIPHHIKSDKGFFFSSLPCYVPSELFISLSMKSPKREETNNPLFMSPNIQWCLEFGLQSSPFVAGLILNFNLTVTIMKIGRCTQIGLHQSLSVSMLILLALKGWVD